MSIVGPVALPRAITVRPQGCSRLADGRAAIAARTHAARTHAARTHAARTTARGPDRDWDSRQAAGLVGAE